MKKSIIIPTGTESHLLTLLESIEKYTDLTDIEIIPVLNGYDGDLNIKYKPIIFPERIGYTKAVNRGIEKSTGDIIILLNDDVILLPQNTNDWINILCNPLKDNVGITCPLKLYSPSAERDFAVFFCVAIKRDMFNKIGLLDEVFNPGYGEDTDFSIKVEQLGYKVIQVPTSDIKNGGQFMVGQFPIYHEGEKTFGVNKKWEEIKERNQKILHDRYALPPGWFYGGDIEEYRRLVEDVPVGGTIGELGCFKGRSLASVSDIIKRNKLNVIVVDTFEGTESEKTPAERLMDIDFQNEFEENVGRFGLKPTIFKGKTNDITLPDDTFDLLFIDACHEYEFVRDDIKKWFSTVKNNGTISGHDYGSHDGVAKAVNEKFSNIRVYASIWSKRITK